MKFNEVVTLHKPAACALAPSLHDETDETNAVKVTFRPNGERVGLPDKATSKDTLIIYSMERGLLIHVFCPAMAIQCCEILRFESDSSKSQYPNGSQVALSNSTIQAFVCLAI